MQKAPTSPRPPTSRNPPWFWSRGEIWEYLFCYQLFSPYIVCRIRLLMVVFTLVIILFKCHVAMQSLVIIIWGIISIIQFDYLPTSMWNAVLNLNSNKMAVLYLLLILGFLLCKVTVYCLMSKRCCTSGLNCRYTLTP